MAIAVCLMLLYTAIVPEDLNCQAKSLLSIFFALILCLLYILMEDYPGFTCLSGSYSTKY